jgi:hypothetical protein
MMTRKALVGVFFQKTKIKRVLLNNTTLIEVGNEKLSVAVVYRSDKKKNKRCRTSGGDKVNGRERLTICW